MRRNSSFTGWPSSSIAIFCVRSPSATALMTRATSVLGCTKPLISELTELTICDHPPVTPRNEAVSVIRPSRLTTRSTRVISSGQSFVKLGHAVEFLSDLAHHAAIAIDRYAGGKVAVGSGRKRRQQIPQLCIGRLPIGRRSMAVGPPAAVGRPGCALILGHGRIVGLHAIQLLVEFIGMTATFRCFSGARMLFPCRRVRIRLRRAIRRTPERRRRYGM